jgi:hypothetical protein
MLVRISKEVLQLLPTDIDAKGVNEIIKSSVTKSGEKVDRSSACVDVLYTKTMELLGMVHNDTQYIVESIKSRKVEKASMSDELVIISPLQMERINQAYDRYVAIFKKEKSWGTDSKDYTSTQVFDKPNPVVDQSLHYRLKDFLLNSDVDYTEY